MKNPSGVIIVRLHCSECGEVFTIPRNNGRLREKGHKKDIYCPFCQKVTKFTQTRKAAY